MTTEVKADSGTFKGKPLFLTELFLLSHDRATLENEILRQGRCLVRSSACTDTVNHSLTSQI
jgi:hypothetical protein